MPSDLILKTMNTVHRSLLKLSGGRIGWTASSMPVLELTTIGRKSGKSRTVMLTSPLQQGSAYVVVASRGGDDHHPAWFLNLRDNADAVVRIQGGDPQRMRARVLAPDERRTLWPKLTGDHARYAGYQTKTDREIPLILLEPFAD